MRSLVAAECKLQAGVASVVAAELLLKPAVAQISTSECSSHPHLIERIVIDIQGTPVPATPVMETIAPVVYETAPVVLETAAPAVSTFVESAAPAVAHCSGCIYNQHAAVETASMPTVSHITHAAAPACAAIVQEVVGHTPCAANTTTYQQIPALHKILAAPQPTFVAAPVAEQPDMMARMMQLLGRGPAVGVPETRPASLQEYLAAAFTSEALQTEQKFVRDNYDALMQNYLRVIKPFVFDVRDISYLVNDNTFYQWLQGAPITAAVRAKIDEMADANKDTMIVEMAKKFLSKPVQESDAVFGGEGLEGEDSEFDEDFDLDFDDAAYGDLVAETLF